MVNEQLSSQTEQTRESDYTHREFEAVFSNFCDQYTERVAEVSGHQISTHETGFFGLSEHVGERELGRRLVEIGRAMGEEPRWTSTDDVEEKVAIIHEARRLAWNAITGAVNQLYIDRLESSLDKVRKSGQHNQVHNLARLKHERTASRNRLVAQNHALRNYFDSPLATALGNDSPEGMRRLFNHIPFMGSENKERLVRGISLEIAVKRHMEQLAQAGRLSRNTVAYGTDEQDQKGGDLVVVKPGEVDFIDVKRSMPERFADGDRKSVV